MYFKLLFCFLGLYLSAFAAVAETNSSQANKSSRLQVAAFDIDATPPVGYEMSYNTMIKSWDLGLRARGIVLVGSGQPVILLAIDWLGISHDAHDVFQRKIAESAGTIPQRVAVHTVHQHDAPFARLDLKEGSFGGHEGIPSDNRDSRQTVDKFLASVISRLDSAIQHSLENTRSITHIGYGKAEVYKVASNRSILGPDGEFKATRFTSCEDSALRAAPEGVIDPMVSLVSFWNQDKPVAVLSYYATHPQSYYRTGVANPDFPGVARFLRQLAVPEALHVHFNGAGGNIGAGKYNDGSHENRGILAKRLADGMKRAWESTERHPISANSFAWDVKPVVIPADTTKNNAYVDWYKSGDKIDIQCLTLGRARILHLPAELSVEYQLAAKAMRPDLFVTVAAYSDYSPHYIPTAIEFRRGGFEAGASWVTSEAEGILMEAMRKLLNAHL